jgi:hypothetical protein
MTIACEQEFWAAEQALDRLQRKLASLPGWRASLAWEQVGRAKEELSGQQMFEIWHLPSMPKDFTHWRDKYSHGDEIL